MEQHFQDVAQNIQYEKFKYLCSSFCSTFRPKTYPTTVSWNNEIINPLYGTPYWDDENLE